MQDPSTLHDVFPDTQEYERIPCSRLTQRQQRSLVFHLLYAMDAFSYQTSLESISDNLSRGFGYIITPEDTVFQRAQAIVDVRETLDTQIEPLLAHWRFERIGVATRLILRFAMWELMYTDAQPVVVINEAVELAKCFAELEAYKFINGILDRWVKERQHT